MQNSGLEFIKSVDIKDSIHRFIERQLVEAQQNDNQEEIERIKQIKESIETGSFQEIHNPRECKYSFNVNDNMDVVIKIESLKKMKQEQDKMNIKKQIKTIKTAQGANMVKKLRQGLLRMIKAQEGSLIYMQRGNYNIENDALSS